MKTQYFRIIAGVLLLSILLAGCGAAAGAETPEVEQQPLTDLNDDIVTASAEVIASKRASPAFMVGGQRAEIYVKAGDPVKSGDVLAALPEDALPQSIINAQADLIVAEKALEDLLSSDSAQAQSLVKLREAQDAYDKVLDYYESLFEPYEYLRIVYQRIITPIGVRRIPSIKKVKVDQADDETIADTEANLALAKARLEDAQREFDRLTSGNTPEIEAARTRVAAIQAAIAQAKLTAPFSGTVVELYVNSGEMVSPGAPVLLLADLSTLQVQTTDLNEVDVARIQIGDPVKVTFDALPDTIVTGKVTEIALKNSPGSGVYYSVTITLDETPDVLRWGMSAFVEFQVSK